jgi:hypothetical protein
MKEGLLAGTLSRKQRRHAIDGEARRCWSFEKQRRSVCHS